jgi:dolichyl-phosphate beta-glucosyltransferase
MTRNGKVEISVIVPAYNEETRLSSTLPRLWGSLKSRFSSFEIIVVDDGSKDRTAEIVSSFCQYHPEIRIISFEQNRGKGHAVRTGVLEAIGEYVLFCDADLSTPIREVKKLLSALEEGNDVAIGSRASQDSKIIKYQPLYRVLMGKTFNKIVRILGVPGIKDTQCGFKCFPREVAQEIFSRSRIDGFSFDVEILYIARRLGLRIAEVGVLWKNSPMSKVHPVKHSLQMLRDLLLIRFYGVLGLYEAEGAFRTRMEV